MCNILKSKIIKLWENIYTALKDLINLSKYSIRYKFTLTIILIVLIPMGFYSIYLYKNTYSILRKNAESSLKDSVNIISYDLESNFDLINKTSILFMSDTTIKNMLTSDSKNDPYLKTQKKIEINRELENLLLFNYAWDKKLLKSIFIYEDLNTYYTISRNPFTSVSSQRNYNIAIELHSSNKEKEIVPPSFEDQTIYFARNIYDLNTLKNLGTLVLGIDVNSLSEIDNSLIKYEDIRIITYDMQGIVFSDTKINNLGKKVDKSLLNFSNPSNIQEIVLDGRTYLAAIRKIDGYNLNSLVAVPEDQVFLDLKYNMKNYMYSIFLSILFSLITGLYISSKVIKPIEALTDTVEKLKKGNFNEKLPPSKYIELNQLNMLFNKAVDEINYLIHEVYEKQLLLKESELAVLQSQVNPHFLFNVLETLGWEAKFSNNQKIYEMVSSLSLLMRGSIALNKNDKITINEELKIAESYLKLQKMRFEDRLSYEIYADKNIIEKYLIPKLCLLTIVENAVIHGLESKREGGRVIIRVKEDSEKIFIKVSDNGKGFDTSLYDINNNENRYEGKSHIGLYNANRRIKLVYGTEYGISIQSSIGRGTEATIIIPHDERRDVIVQDNDC